MSIIKTILKVFNGSVWNEYYPKTSSDQVVHTKSDGTATTVQDELLAQNSAMPVVLYTGTLVAKSDGTSGFSADFSVFKFVRVYGRCFDELFTYDIPMNNRMSSSKRFRGSVLLPEFEAGEIYYSNSAISQDAKTFMHLYTGYYKVPGMEANERQNNTEYIITKVEGYK